MSIPMIRLHPDGPEISRIVQGLGSIVRKGVDTPAAMADYMCACLDVGINTFDLAAVYAGGEAERLFGEALSRQSALRDRLCIITKYGIEGGGPGYHCYDTSYKAIVRSADRSLSRLHTDCVDLFLMHRPDLLLDADEVARALTDLHRDGKIRHVGVSNFLPAQFRLLASRLSLPLLVNEVPYNILNMDCAEDGTIDLCQQLRVTPLFYSPLCRGRLTHPPETQQEIRVRAVLEDIAAEENATVDQVALAFVLRHPSRGAAILGGARTEWLESAAAASRMMLTRDAWFRIWTAAKGREVP